MVQINNDLPVQLKPHVKVMSITVSDDVPPGAASVKSMPNKGTGWYCDACMGFITPIMIRRGDTIYPACRICFCDELAVTGENENVAIPKVVPSADAQSNVSVASN